MLLLPVTATAASAASARATTSKVTLEAFSRPFSQPHRTSSRRAFFSTSPIRLSQSKIEEKQDASSIADQIRTLMRDSAQPVALVTTFLSPRSSDGKAERLIHGATLSSFSSISLDPNLVCFSMKTPSKLADALAHHHSTRGENKEEVDFVVNLLAESQAKLAQAYAIPGTPPYPHPNAKESEQTDKECHPLRETGLVEVKQGMMPVVKGALGSFGCQVVESIDLSKFDPNHRERKAGESKSLLYIARVLHIYTTAQASEIQPLIYHRSKFVSTTLNPLT
ncbi:uncharacterized protein UTRI_06375 [Ustilago trichophora]|uniref:Flavin reductase like domain-containing protein n=1 Tax=Ustilago trichophora TaxID=86804 RepID=A0A5C3EK61_9BASI|nr:uncharacterized protein UTRI_06375 [Ustilago trichophora]